VGDGTAPIVFAIGIHGQSLHVHRRHGVVVAKVSSQALPTDAARALLTTRAVTRIVQVLASDR
jgi:hypothetical protein